MNELVFLLIILFCMFGTAVYYHEMVHGAVCESSGGVPEYHINIFSASTICVDYENTGFSDFEKYNILNELIGYNLLVILVVLVLYPMYLKCIKI